MDAENGIITGHLDKNAVDTIRVIRKQLSGLDMIVMLEYQQTGRGFAIPLDMADDFISMFQAAKEIALPKPLRPAPPSMTAAPKRVPAKKKPQPKRKVQKGKAVDHPPVNHQGEETTP